MPNFFDCLPGPVGHNLHSLSAVRQCDCGAWGWPRSTLLAQVPAEFSIERCDAALARIGSVSGHRGHFAWPPGGAPGAGASFKCSIQSTQQTQYRSPVPRGRKDRIRANGKSWCHPVQTYFFQGRLIGDRLTSMFDADQRLFLCETCAGSHRFMAPSGN